MREEEEVVRFGPFASAIANGVRKGGAIHLSGQVGLDADGKLAGDGGFAAPVRQAYTNIAEVLSKFDATMEDVVDETWFATDVGAVMGDLAQFTQIRSEAYGGEPQVAKTLIQISALVMPEPMVEIEIVAQV